MGLAHTDTHTVITNCALCNSGLCMSVCAESSSDEEERRMSVSLSGVARMRKKSRVSEYDRHCSVTILSLLLSL